MATVSVENRCLRFRIRWEIFWGSNMEIDTRFGTNKKSHQFHKLAYIVCFLLFHTVDGSEILRSPVEVGSLSHH